MTIIRCVICGRILNQKRKKYCSDECRYHKRFEYKFNLGYEKCKIILDKIKKQAHVDFSGRNAESAYYKRIYCYICKEILNCSSAIVGKVIGIDHSTVIHHVRNCDEKIINIAKNFYSTGKFVENKDVKVITEFEQNIRKYNFSYSSKKAI